MKRITRSLGVLLLCGGLLLAGPPRERKQVPSAVVSGIGDFWPQYWAIMAWWMVQYPGLFGG